MKPIINHACDKLYTLFAGEYYIDIPVSSLSADGQVFELMLDAYKNLCRANKVCFTMDVVFTCAVHAVCNNKRNVTHGGLTISAVDVPDGFFYTSADVESMG